MSLSLYLVSLLYSLATKVCFSIIIQRLYDGDVIYGIDKKICLNDFDRTSWITREANDIEGLCRCREANSTFLLDGCYSSDQLAEECFIRVQMPLFKTPLLKTIKINTRQYFQIRIDDFYGLRLLTRINKCHVKVSRKNVLTGKWLELDSVVAVDTGTLVIIPANADVAETDGMLMKLVFICDNKHLGCVVMKSPGVSEVAEESDKIGQMNEFGQLSRSNIKHSLFMFPNTDARKHARNVRVKIGKTQTGLVGTTRKVESRQHNFHRESTKKHIKENKSRSVHFRLESVQNSTDDQEEERTNLPNVTVVSTVLTGLVVALGCVVCIVGERVYRVIQRDKLHDMTGMPDISQPTLINDCSKDQDEEVKPGVDEEKLDKNQNRIIPQIIIEKPEEDETDVTEKPSHYEFTRTGKHRRSFYNKMRLSRDFSISLKSKTDGKRQSLLFDSLDLDQDENEIDNNDLSTPPLYKKTKSKR